jgi:hypothetical protein
MPDTQHRSHKLAYLFLGIAVPVTGYLVTGYLLWSKGRGFCACRKKKELDRSQQIAVEDSFPASDPPATW